MEGKDRNDSLDNIRGLFMCLIPLSHYIRVAGGFSLESPGGVLYTAIMIFTMEGFVLLSGFLSKNPHRAREGAFRTFLLPYLVWTTVFFCYRSLIFGTAVLDYLNPPFALWFLWTLFFYRFFLKDLIKIPYLMPLALILYLSAGQIRFFDEPLELGRTASFLLFFLIGYRLDWKAVERIRALPFRKVILLATAFAAIVGLYCFVLPYSSGFLLLRSPGAAYGLAWYQDLGGRVVIGAATLMMMTILLNRMPDRSCFLTHIGRNTMPLYILHLFVRYLVKAWGVPAANPFIHYGTILILWAASILLFTSKPVIRLYDGFMNRIAQGAAQLMSFLRSVFQR